MSKTTKPEPTQCRMCLDRGRIYNFYRQQHYPCPYCKTRRDGSTGSDKGGEREYHR